MDVLSRIQIVSADLCKILSFEHEIPLKLADKTSKVFQTNTTLSSLHISNGNIDCIYLRKDKLHPVLSLFALAHEYRHAWQFLKNDIDLNFYETNHDSSSYNNSYNEIDANAFAIVYMEYYQGIRITLPLNPKIISQTNRRIHEIKLEMNIK